MTSKVSNERVIRTLPRWYSDAACPYVSDSFVPEVTEYVHKQASNGMNRLRMGKCILVGDFDIGKTSLIHKFAFDAFLARCQPTIGVDFRIQKFTVLNSLYQLNIWDTAGQERYRSITSAFYRNSHAILLVFDMSRISTLASVRQWYQEVMQIVVQREVQRLKNEFSAHCRTTAPSLPHSQPQRVPRKKHQTKQSLQQLQPQNHSSDKPPTGQQISPAPTQLGTQPAAARIPESRYIVEPFVFLVGTKRDQLSESTLKFVETEATKIAQELNAEYWSVSALNGCNVQSMFARIAALTFQEVVLAEIEQQKEKERLVAAKPGISAICRDEDVVKLGVATKKRKSIRCMLRLVRIPKWPKKLKSFTDRYIRGKTPASAL